MQKCYLSGEKQLKKKRVKIITTSNEIEPRVYNSRNKKLLRQLGTSSSKSLKTKSYVPQLNLKASSLSSKTLKQKYLLFPDIDRMKHLNNDIMDSIFNINVNNDNFCGGYYASTDFSSSFFTSKGFSQTKTNFTDAKIKINNLKKSMDNLGINGIQSYDSSINKKKSILKAPTKLSQFLPLNSNKLLLANMARSKKKSIMIQKTDKNGKKSIIDEENQNHLFFEKAKMKRGSLVDRYIFKIANPDGVIEDYITEGDKPGDKYKRFRNQLIKGKNKIYKLIQDVKRTQMISDTMLGVYITKLKGKKYNNNKEV